MLLYLLIIGLFFTKFQMYLSKVPNSFWISMNCLALFIADAIFNLFLIIPSSLSNLRMSFWVNFETTKGKKPIIYIHGKGQLIKALEESLEGMKKGQKKSVIIKPEDAYGKVREDYFTEVPIEGIPQELREEGKVLTISAGKDEDGKDLEPVKCVITEIKGEKATLDFNHPLAGKTLRYRVEIIDVKDKMQFG